MAVIALTGGDGQGAPRLCFVSTRRGNRFLTELLEALATSASEAGAQVSFAFDGYPPREHPTAYVIVPHEFFAIVPQDRWPGAEELRRTIALCVEMPGTPWFEMAVAHAGRAAAVLAINRHATVELRRRGVAAEHFQLGYCQAWDAWNGRPLQPRPLDVVYLGAADCRRNRLLASFGDELWSRRTALYIPPDEPKRLGRPDYLTGADKHRRLGSAKVLINLHREGATGFEWIRILESIANGCVVISEHSTDYAPLVPGEHFLSTRAEAVGAVVNHLLDDPGRLQALRHSAYDFVRRELRMETSIGQLLDIAGRLTSAPSESRRAAARRLLPLQDPDEAAPAEEPKGDLPQVRAALKHLVTQAMETRRRLQALVPRTGDWDIDGLKLIGETPAARLARPRVSVVIPLYNHRREVEDALRSVAASRFDDYEVLVCDDASTDGSARAVEGFIAAHPWIAARLYQSRANAGPSRSRNLLAARSRGDRLFMLDADNKIFPTTLERLTQVLDDNPDAAFAYPMLAAHTAGAAVGLVSALPWEPARLASSNYIDTMALWRRTAFLGIGGFSEDARLQGWEDYDLWCRCADQGERGVLVPEILGWYRRTGHSTLALMDLDTATALSLIRERSPSVFQPVHRPRPSRVVTTPATAPGAYPAAGTIAIFGQYKTGTTALFSLVRNSLPETTRTLFEPSEYTREPDDAQRVVVAKVILAAPEGSSTVRYDTFTSFDRKLCLVRDPRDWVVSGTLFSIQQEPSVHGNPATLEAVLDLLRQKERNPRSVPLVRILARILEAEPGRSLAQARRWMARQLAWLMDFESGLEDRCLVRYERLVDGDLEDFEAYLQIPLVGSTAVDAAYEHVPRTKSFGDWRHWFTPEDVAFFQPVFSAYMERYGYGDDWRLADRPVVAPEHTTGYVRRGVQRRQIGRPPAATSEGLTIEPFLHIDAGRISNPLNGRTVVAGDSRDADLRALESGSLTIGGLAPAQRRRMADEGWLIPRQPEPARRFALRYVSLESHSVCNQRCVFCPVSVAPRPGHVMPTELYDRIARQLSAYSSTIEAVFMNNYNEPTADSRFVEQVGTLRAYDLPPAVLTNGTGLTPARVNELMAIGGLRFLSINLSTLDRDRYRRDRGEDHLPLVLRNLDYLRDRRLAPQMEIVVLGRGDELHHGDAEDIRTRFAGTHFEVKSYEVMDRAGRLPIGRKPPQPHARLCGCDNVGSRPVEHLHVTADGTCVFCCEDYDERYAVGNLTTQTVDEVLESPEIVKFRRWAYGLDDAPADFMCRHCVFARSQ